MSHDDTTDEDLQIETSCTTECIPAVICSNNSFLIKVADIDNLNNKGVATYIDARLSHFKFLGRHVGSQGTRSLEEKVQVVHTFFQPRL